MNSLSPAQKKALAAVYGHGDCYISQQTAISLRRLGMIRGRFASLPAVTTEPTQWTVTDAGKKWIEGEADP